MSVAGNRSAGQVPTINILLLCSGSAFRLLYHRTSLPMAEVQIWSRRRKDDDPASRAGSCSLTFGKQQVCNLLKQNDLLRVGRDYDGGYVISESLMRRTSILLSFGINDDWSFEEDFCRRTGVTCFGFDFSISKALFLQRGWQQIRFFFGDIIKRRKIQWKRFSEARRHFQLYRSFGRFFRKNVFAGYGIDNASQGYFKTLDEISPMNTCREKRTSSPKWISRDLNSAS